MRPLIVVLALALMALVGSGCGSGHGGGHGGGSSSSSSKAGNATDAAFVGDMIPHHESAIEMAELAQERAKHPELRKLADDIVAAQQREIDTMRPLKDQLGKAHGGGHMSGNEHMRGMHTEIGALRDAKEFDRAFIDEMIPHHRGALVMAKEELAKGRNPKLKALARDIIAAQKREIAQMRAWREKWYGRG